MLKDHLFSKKIMLKQNVRLWPVQSNRIKIEHRPRTPQQTCQLEMPALVQFTIISVNGLFIGLNSRRRGREDLLCF